MSFQAIIKKTPGISDEEISSHLAKLVSQTTSGFVDYAIPLVKRN
jgi:hypothetical protein